MHMRLRLQWFLAIAQPLATAQAPLISAVAQDLHGTSTGGHVSTSLGYATLPLCRLLVLYQLRHSVTSNIEIAMCGITVALLQL
jgi:hypothetical protein